MDTTVFRRQDPYVRGGSNHREDPDLLKGVLASDELRFFPEDSCLLCLREGKVKADERCFHRHWPDRPERRHG